MTHFWVAGGVDYERMTALVTSWAHFSRGIIAELWIYTKMHRWIGHEPPSGRITKEVEQTRGCRQIQQLRPKHIHPNWDRNGAIENSDPWGKTENHASTNSEVCSTNHRWIGGIHGILQEIVMILWRRSRRTYELASSTSYCKLIILSKFTSGVL